MRNKTVLLGSDVCGSACKSTPSWCRMSASTLFALGLFVACGALWTSSGSFVDLGTAAGGPYSEAKGINDAGYIVQNDMYFWGPPGAVYLRSPSGSVTNIGPVPGYNWAYGTGINNSNQICGYGSIAWNSGYQDSRAFRWDPPTDPTPGMHVIAPLPGGTYIYGMAINESGVVVGYSNVAGGGYHPFAWDPINGLVDIGLPQPHRILWGGLRDQ